MEELYKTKVLTDVNSTQLLNTDITKGIRASCPLVKSHDISSCFKALIQPVQIRSAQHLWAVASIGVAAAAIDKAAGYDAITAALMTLDNVLTTIEKVNLEEFHLSRIQHRSAEDYIGLVRLRQEEEKALEKIKEKLATKLREKFMEVKAGLETSKQAEATKKWQVAFFDRIKPRAVASEAREFKFRPEQLLLSRDKVSELFFDERKKFICLHKRVTICNKFSITMCENLMAQAYNACRNSANTRTPASLYDHFAAKIYMREINDCVSPRWKKGYIKAAPACSDTLTEDPFKQGL